MSWKNEQVSEEETKKILEVAREMLRVEGDFVELGCYRGDTSLSLAEVLRGYNRGEMVEKPVENSGEKMLKKVGKSSGKDAERIESTESAKKLWIYDSFEGLPEKTEVDESVLGVNFKRGELAVTKREVKERFLRAGLPVPVIKKGWFSNLREIDLPEKIALAFLDGDLYESIKDSLKLVEPKMADSGVIIVHDYNNLALPGVARAVDEWLRGKNKKVEVFRSMAIIKN